MIKKTEPLKVLLVEDSPRDAELIELTLTEQLPCEVKVTSTRPEFEAALDGETPHLIVSDSNVVSFDGLTALAIARERCPDVPFVFCSGNPSEATQREAYAQGAAGWVSKENDFRQLVSVVRRLSERHLSQIETPPSQNRSAPLRTARTASALDKKAGGLAVSVLEKGWEFQVLALFQQRLPFELIDIDCVSLGERQLDGLVNHWCETWNYRATIGDHTGIEFNPA